MPWNRRCSGVLRYLGRHWHRTGSAVVAAAVLVALLTVATPAAAAAPALTIDAPTPMQVVTTADVPVQVTFAQPPGAGQFKAVLNGAHNVTVRLRVAGTVARGTLTSADGVVPGANALSITVTGPSGSQTRTQFFTVQTRVFRDNKGDLPVDVRQFQSRLIIPEGSIDGYEVALGGNVVRAPTPTGWTCDVGVWVVVVAKDQLAVSQSTTFPLCSPTQVQDLTTFLSALPDIGAARAAAPMVIVNSMNLQPMDDARPGAGGLGSALQSIGAVGDEINGIDLTKQALSVVGTRGAARGTAYQIADGLADENVREISATPASVNGILAQDNKTLFQLIMMDNLTFDVSADGRTVSSGNVSYTLPAARQAHSRGGLHMVVLDRRTLAALSNNYFELNSDAAIAEQTRLAGVVAHLSESDLVFLATVGDQPLPTQAVEQPPACTAVVDDPNSPYFNNVGDNPFLGSCRYVPAGAPQTFTVPYGITSVDVTATGGRGAASQSGGAGGRGATVTAQLTVGAPGAATDVHFGDQLLIRVGGNGDNTVHDSSDAAYNGGGRGGGASLLGGGWPGGGGGGASDVRLAACAHQSCPVVVAGGGGGGGGKGGAGAGAPGGNSGQAGGNAPTGATGGQAGSDPATHNQPGTGSNGSGTPGLPGVGGDGKNGHQAGSILHNGGGGGGGGGGGYVGGGGGGGDLSHGGGGGAGGSNLVPAAGQVVTASTAQPGVTITYPLAGPTLAQILRPLQVTPEIIEGIAGAEAATPANSRYAIVTALAPPFGLPRFDAPEASPAVAGTATGELQVVLTRGTRGGWYQPQTSFAPTTAANTPTHLNTALDRILGSVHADWPVPAPGRPDQAAAFAAVSAQLCGLECTNARTLYDNTAELLATKLGYLQNMRYVAPVPPAPPYGKDAFDEVTTQLEKELTEAYVVAGWRDGVRSILTAAATALPADLQQPYQNIRAAIPVDPTRQVLAKATQILATVAALSSKIPYVGSVIGVINSIVSFGSKLYTDNSGVLLDQLQGTVDTLAAQINGALLSGLSHFDLVLGMIYSDWGKLDAVYQDMFVNHPNDWDATGVTQDRVVTAMSDSAQLGYYRALVPAIFGKVEAIHADTGDARSVGFYDQRPFGAWTNGTNAFAFGAVGINRDPFNSAPTYTYGFDAQLVGVRPVLTVDQNNLNLSAGRPMPTTLVGQMADVGLFKPYLVERWALPTARCTGGDRGAEWIGCGGGGVGSSPSGPPPTPPSPTTSSAPGSRTTSHAAQAPSATTTPQRTTPTNATAPSLAATGINTGSELSLATLLIAIGIGLCLMVAHGRQRRRRRH